MAFAVAGRLVSGVAAQEPRVNLGPAFANSYWQFTLTGTATPANVYQDQNLTTPFSTNQVFSDRNGRFPPIYLDPAVIYRVQLFTALGVAIRGPYDNFQSALPSWGTSQQQSTGPKITQFNEVTSTNSAGGTGNAWTVNATMPGGACVRVYGPSPGGLTLEVDNSATTGAQTATFTATNKPGIATSAPVGWLPVQCDGQIYYTPAWRGDTYVPPVPVTQQVNGQVISCASVTFNGNGTTTLTGAGASASPSSWYTPPVTGIGSSYWINITKTGGTGTFTAAAGVWTNISSGGLTISNTGGPVNGTYQLSTSVTGSPVVANGTIACTFSPVLHVYTSGSGTETIPTGATNVTIEEWAGGGGGGGRSGSVCFGTAGPGGGSGSYSKSSYSVAALGGAGSTFNYAVGPGGGGIVANGGGTGFTGTASSVTAGTVTGFTSMLTNGGVGAPHVGAGAGGAGGAAGTGGNQANTAGNAGTTAVNGNQNDNPGGTGISGTVSGDGSPHGAGGNGTAFNGGTGQSGTVVFSYT